MYSPRETTLIGRLSFPSDLVGLSLSFLDGRSLTSYEAASKGTRQSLQHRPDMFKKLLVRQLANVPQIKSLQSKDGKRALIAWDGGDFQPVLASRASRAVPSPRYLHRVALAADGWYYLYGGHLRLGMSGDVWRFRVEGPKREGTRRGARLSLQWEQVDGPAQADLDGVNDDRDGENSDTGGHEVDSNAGDASENGDTRHEASDDEDEEAVEPAPVIGPPPGAHDAPQGAWQVLAAAVQGQAGGMGPFGNPAHHAALQAAMMAAQQGGGGGEGEAPPPADIDADGHPTRPSPRCAASWTSMPGSNKIYLFGGQGTENDFLGDLWCFHAGRRGECHWERLDAVREAREGVNEEGGHDGAPGGVPEGRWGHTMVEHKGALYMFGGSSPGQAYAGLWRLDPSARPCVWSLLTLDRSQPPARGGHSATVVRDTLYIFGGNIIQNVFNDLWAVDLPAGATWRQIPTSANFPLPRIGHSAVAMGSRILIYGGRNLKTDRYTAGIACFDTELQSFVHFPHTAAFSKRATQQGGMWHGLRMTGHAAVTCSRGIMFVGGLVPRGHSTMIPWVLDVVRGRRGATKKESRGRARVLATAGGCGTS